MFVLSEADHTSDEETRRSTSCPQLHVGGHLVESESCMHQVLTLNALRSGSGAFFARLFEGQSKPVVFPDSSATRGVCRRVRCGHQNHVQVHFLWLQEAVADGRVEVRGASTRPRTPHSDLGTVYPDKRTRAALITTMPLTQLSGQGRIVGAVLALLAGLLAAVKLTPPARRRDRR